MPEWFEALNSDYRYQLTAVGSSAPGLYIAQEVTHGHFVIAGGLPGQKVSWQITGIRQDAWAKKNRIRVEETKPEAEQGYYLYPEGYGLGRDRSVDPMARQSKPVGHQDN